jgi:hypothetical protein
MQYTQYRNTSYHNTSLCGNNFCGKNLILSSFIICFALMFLGYPSHIFAQNIATQSTAGQNINPNPYIINNIVAESTAKSAIDAKNLAMTNARKQGLVQLFKNLEIDPKLAEKFTSTEINDTVRSEQVVSEKITANAYSGVFNITFSKPFVRSLLKTKNISTEKYEKEKLGSENTNNSEKPISSKNSTKKEVATSNKLNRKKIILLPIKQEESGYNIWEKENDWREQFIKIAQQYNKKSSELEIAFLEPDINNINILDPNNIEDLQFNLIEPILSQNKAESLYLAIFDFDKIDNKARITIKHFARKPKKSIALTFVNINYLKYNELLKRLSQKTVAYLETSQDVETETEETIKINILTNSFDSWIKINQKIIASNLFADIVLHSIDQKQTTISCRYLGDLEKANEELGRYSLKLTKEDAGSESIFFLSLIEAPSDNEQQ